MPFRLPGLRVLVTEFSQHTVPRFLRGLSDVRCMSSWKRFPKDTGSMMRDDKNAGGSCFFCCLACSSIDFRGGLISRAKLVARFKMFLKGEWTGLIKASAVCATQAACARRRKRQRPGLDHRVARGVKRWSIWASCHPPDKRSKGHPLHQEQMKHW